MRVLARILQALKDSGLDKNTIVIFTSDHGDCLGRHNEISKNNIYEESIIIPFIIRWPGHIKPGKDDLLLSTPDITPTILAHYGFKKFIPKVSMDSDYLTSYRPGKENAPLHSYIYGCHWTIHQQEKEG